VAQQKIYFMHPTKKTHAIDYRVTGIASGILSFKGQDIVALYRISGSILAEFLADFSTWKSLKQNASGLGIDPITKTIDASDDW
jgi:hypothetical protein